MGRRKKGRDVDGVLLLDKPVGGSSNDALQRARRLFNARKAGHTGSLDPLASGLLPVCFGEATKVSSWLLYADKRYRVTVALDYETDTGDRDGRVTQHNDVPVPSWDEITAVTRRFIGEQKQVPPMYSALKHNGRPLYEWARDGVTIERQPRPINVYDIDLLAVDNDQLTLAVSVSRGTYVRTLVEDMARAWGGAAHVSALRRTRVGGYDGSAMLTFEHLEQQAEQGFEMLDQTLVPASHALADWPAVHLDADAESAVSHGQNVHAPVSTRGWVRIMNEAGGFLGLGEIDQAGQLAPRRLFTRVLN